MPSLPQLLHFRVDISCAQDPGRPLLRLQRRFHVGRWKVYRLHLSGGSWLKLQGVQTFGRKDGQGQVGLNGGIESYACMPACYDYVMIM